MSSWKMSKTSLRSTNFLADVSTKRMDGFLANPSQQRGFRVGIDASIWFFHAAYGKEGENPELRTLFFRCCRLLQSPLGFAHVVSDDFPCCHHVVNNWSLPFFGIGTQEVTDLVAKIAAIYSPERTVGYTAACCSDHQSFHEQGYPATQSSNALDGLQTPCITTAVCAYPLYPKNASDQRFLRFYRSYLPIHTIQMTSATDPDMTSAKSGLSRKFRPFATLLHAAGFDLPDEDDLEL
ncbi:hypothetical protein BU15DRAFT_75268 [Melanogaster broomeanus]|nr:hypothetical protein BU15DRAFT_75268 [Melanogaster broomeanus]